MEGSRTHFEFQQDEHLDAFLRCGTSLPVETDCIVHLSKLPYSYRKEIERGYSTGWESLDKFMQGLRLGELTVVTADTGVGKTTFCTQLMVNCAMQGVSVWINSWEMKPEMTMRKLAFVVLRRPMKCSPFTDADNDEFNAWSDNYQVYINPKTIGIDINTFSNQLVRARDLGIKIVMIDHLDYLVSSKNKEKLHEAIDETVKRLHELAFALSMHFVLICHPRQSTSGTEEIGLHSLKGSSAIKQYADNVLLLHRCARTDEQAHPGKTKIRIAKNRMFGIEGVTHLFYQPLWDGYMEFMK